MWLRRDCGAGGSSHGTAVVCGERKLSAGPCDMWEIVIKKSSWPVVSALEFPSCELSFCSCQLHLKGRRTKLSAMRGDYRERRC